MIGRHTLVIILITIVAGNLLSQSPPNIVIILADDLDAVITPQFFPEVLPVVDSLKKVGIEFTNSFVPTSICCPSRAGLLSGKYAHNNDVYRNAGEKGGWDDFIDDEPYTFPALLSRNGYRTAMIGKYLNGYEIKEKNLPPLPYGWTDGAVFVDAALNSYKGYNYELFMWNDGKAESDSTWAAPVKEVQHYGKHAEDYSTDVLAGKAAAFIRSASTDSNPFFLYLTPTSPHFPLPAAARHTDFASNWLNVMIPKTPNSYNDCGKMADRDERKKPRDKAPFLTKTWKKRVRQEDKGIFFYNATFDGKIPPGTKSFWQGMWYHRMGSLYALNDLVRQIISTLKETGEWDNTLLIFTSDNGFHFGNHGLQHKGTPYEESIRVPLVMAAGDSVQMDGAAVINEWVINLDLAPTILQLASVPLPDDLDGKALQSLIAAETVDTAIFRDRFVMEYIGPGAATEFFTKHPRLINRVLPSYMLDIPTYNAIRMRVKNENGGERIYKYIEWQKYPGHLRFRHKMQHSNGLNNKINAGHKRLNKKKEKMDAIYAELYDLTDDPYEMDNLLYYHPGKYQVIASMLQEAMYEIIHGQPSTAD